MVLTQDIQIFPGVLAGLFKSSTRDAKEVPSGVQARFINTGDDNLLEVWHLPYEGDKAGADNHPVAVIFHGNAEDVESVYGMQRWLGSLGIASYSFDYRGYGRSSGWPNDAGLKSDTLAILNLVESEYDMEKHPRVLVGVSIGTGLAAFGAMTSDSGTLLLLSPYTSLKDLVGEMPVFGFLKGFLWYDLNTAEYLSGLKNYCLIAAFGDRDTTIPGSHAEKLIESGTGSRGKKLIRINGASHNELMTLGKDQIGKELLTCISSQ